MVKAKIDPVRVECATCLAVPGEPCSTRYARSPVASHPARSLLARVGVACPRCGASELQPCVNAAGKAQVRIHTARSDAARRVKSEEVTA